MTPKPDTTKTAVRMGPVELFVIAFPENRFTGEIAPALADLVESRTIRVVDLVFVTKDAAGDVLGFELSTLDDEVRAAFDPLLDEPSGLVSDEDIEDLGVELEPDSSAALLLVEHVWATGLRDAIADAGGELVASVHIPKETVDEVLALRAGV
jgi:uncharacterized membrane protein